MALKLRQINKSYGDTELFRNFSLEMSEGSITAFLGPSGYGKTTLLRMIAGLEPAGSGEIQWAGKAMDERMISKELKVSYLFQEDRLVPWLSAEKNVELVLRTFLSKTDSEKRRNWALDLVGLTDSGRQMPDAMSGGMQRRVAIARTVAHDGDLILLDEPFKGLDAQLKENLLSALTSLWKEQKKTILLVTHDLDEARRMADDIYYLEGRPVIARAASLP